MELEAEIKSKEYNPFEDDYHMVSWWEGDVDATAGITNVVLQDSIYCKANPVIGEVIHFPGVSVRLVHYNPYKELWSARYVSGNTSEPDKNGEAPVGRTQEALDLVRKYGGDAAHHNQWVLDQVVRILAETPEAYQEWCHAYAYHDGEFYGEWDEGVAP